MIESKHEEYQELLPCGDPDLAKSAQNWLDNVHFGGKIDLSALSDSLQESLHRQLVEKDPRDDFPGLSQSWGCTRKRAYQALGYEADSFDWSAKSKFASGDFYETFYLYALLHVWPIQRTVLHDEGQKEVSLEVGGQEIIGHPDGLLGDDYLIEVKSTGQAKFDARWNEQSILKMIDAAGVIRFDGSDEEHRRWWGNYAAQAMAYQMATQRKKTLFLFAGRDYGLAAGVLEFDSAFYDDVLDQWHEVISAKEQGELPPRPVGVQELIASDKDVWSGADSFPCGYCGFQKHCLEHGTKKVDDQTGKVELRFE